MSGVPHTLPVHVIPDYLLFYKINIMQDVPYISLVVIMPNVSHALL